jgi:RHS repeat-associated protein
LAYGYQFDYDSQGHRIRHRELIGGYLSGTRYVIHDGNVPVGEWDPDSEEFRWFIRGLGIAEGTGDVIAEVDPDGTPHYYVANHRGDTVAVIDEDSVKEAEIEYDAFGNIIEQTGTFTPRFTFSTKEYLPEAQLYLYAYRVYDPVAGRWTQRDPLDYYDSPNLYQFCGNCPVNALDPNGSFVIGVPTVVGGFGGLVAGAVRGCFLADTKLGESRLERVCMEAGKGGLVGLAVGFTIDTKGASARWLLAVGGITGIAVEGYDQLLHDEFGTTAGLYQLGGAGLGNAVGAATGGLVPGSGSAANAFAALVASVVGEAGSMFGGTGAAAIQKRLDELMENWEWTNKELEKIRKGEADK